MLLDVTKLRSSNSHNLSNPYNNIHISVTIKMVTLCPMVLFFFCSFDKDWIICLLLLYMLIVVCEDCSSKIFLQVLLSESQKERNQNEWSLIKQCGNFHIFVQQQKQKSSATAILATVKIVYAQQWQNFADKTRTLSYWS